MPLKVLTPGHRYELPDFEPTSIEGQKIQFIEKRPYPHAPDGGPTTQLETVNNGTTNEAVLEMLIDRLQFLNGKFPCRENAVALTHIETALMWLEKRTKDRLKRGVEGKAAA